MVDHPGDGWTAYWLPDKEIRDLSVQILFKIQVDKKVVNPTVKPVELLAELADVRPITANAFLSGRQIGLSSAVKIATWLGEYGND